MFVVPVAGSGSRFLFPIGSCSAFRCRFECAESNANGERERRIGTNQERESEQRTRHRNRERSEPGTV